MKSRCERDVTRLDGAVNRGARWGTPRRVRSRSPTLGPPRRGPRGGGRCGARYAIRRLAEYTALLQSLLSHLTYACVLMIHAFSDIWYFE